MHPELSSVRLQEFHSYIEERFKVYRSRAAGVEPPWTVDPVIQGGAFVNVFRDWDVTSVTAAQIMANLKDADLIATGIAMALSNKPSTMQAVGPLSHASLKSPLEVQRIAHAIKQNGFGGAYIIPSFGAACGDKPLRVAEKIAEIASAVTPAALVSFRKNPKSGNLIQFLQGFKWIGPLIAYQAAQNIGWIDRSLYDASQHVATTLQIAKLGVDVHIIVLYMHVVFFVQALYDRRAHVNLPSKKVPCNGAKRGLSWLYPAQKNFSDSLAIRLMWELLNSIPPNWNQLMGRPFHIGAVELNLCEVDKYFKVKYRSLRCKRIRFYQNNVAWSGPQHRHENSKLHKLSNGPRGQRFKSTTPGQEIRNLQLCWLCCHVRYRSKSSKNSFLKCSNANCFFGHIA